MTRAIGLSVLLLGLVGAPQEGLPLGAQPAQAAELPLETASFTAEGVVQVGEDRLIFKIYHKRGKERQEMAIDGLFQITILRPDLGTAYLVQPEAHSVIPLPLEEMSLWPRYRLHDDHYEITEEARESEGGEMTTRFRIASKEGASRVMDILVWVTDDGIEMRLEGEIEIEGLMESVLLLRRDVERREIDDKLFDPYESIQAVMPPPEVPESHQTIGKSSP